MRCWWSARARAWSTTTVAEQYQARSRGCGIPPDTMLRMSAAAAAPALSLYREIDRADWARLAADMAQPLAETEIVQIRGIGDLLDMAEVREVYLPLSRLLSLYANATKRLGADTSS